MARPKGTTGMKQLTEAEYLRIRTLSFDSNLSIPRIREITGYSKAQIRHALRNPAPKKRCGRPRLLSTEQEEELVEFVCASKANRRMSFLELSLALFNAVFSIWAVKHALYRLGFRRRIARLKPPLSERTVKSA
ncbi:hypothetical protein V8F33_002974 [Rhypophila sp. PSN 637]